MDYRNTDYTCLNKFIQYGLSMGKDKVTTNSLVISAEKGYDSGDQKPSDCSKSRVRINS